MVDKFEKRLQEAIDKKLKIDLEGDESQDVELDGAKKKAADGTHRPDKPVEFVQLEPTLEFDDKEHEQSDQARQDLETDLPEGTIDR